VSAAHSGQRLSSVWAQDESRFGLHTVLRRRLRLRAVKPVCGSCPSICPPTAPNSNPIERWWQQLKDAVANTLFGALEPLRACLDAELRAWTNAPQRLRSLTGYPYILDALNSLA
jgi:transposase